MVSSTLHREPPMSVLAPAPRPASVSAAGLFAHAGLTDDLALVEQRIIERTASRAAVLSESGVHTVSAGGKRLRAALVLLAARLGTYNLPRAIHPAASIELLHAASLVHDDLVDHAGLRRGMTTVHTRWDGHVALMLGDYMFALATEELSHEPDARVIQAYAAASHTIVLGELNPVTQLAPLDVSLAQYRRKIGSKTAALFEAGCKAGMIVGGGTDVQIEALATYGYELGIAFQIVDDVLDFTSDSSVLGKPAGHDMREGTLTLPLIYAVATSTHPTLRALATNPQIAPEDVPDLVSLVITEGGTEQAMADARRAIERARHALDRFPQSPAKRTMLDLASFVLDRQS